MVREELENPTEKRLSRVFGIANTLNVILYTFSSVFGYLSFLGKTPELVINRKVTASDYAMLIGKCVITFDLVGSYLINHVTCRE